MEVASSGGILSEAAREQVAELVRKAYFRLPAREIAEGLDRDIRTVEFFGGFKRELERTELA